MRSKLSFKVEPTDSKDLGTPVQRPFPFGGQRGLIEPQISVRAGEGAHRKGFLGVSNPIRYGKERQDVDDETWLPEGAGIEVEDYAEQDCSQ